MVELTPREREVLHVVAWDGARSLTAIGQVLDPPISPRTVEVHIASIAQKLPSDFEPDAPGFWRVVMAARHYILTGREVVEGLL